MSSCIWGPQLDSEWLSWPYLHLVGHGGVELHHTVSRAPNQHLCSGYQWKNCKSTFLSASFESAHDAAPLLMNCMRMGVLLCSFWPHSRANTLPLCPRVRLRHVRDLHCTCGPWRVSCWLAQTRPVGLKQTSCVSALRSVTSGMPGMS